MAEDADEVKVFRRRGGEPVDDDPVPHSSLAEDKKDAALETELEIPHGHHHIKALPLLLGATTTTTTSTSIKPNLVPLNGSGLSPGYGAGFMPFFPFLMGPYGMPSPFGRLAPPAHDASRTSPFVLSLEQRLSPHYAAAAAAAAAPYYFGAGALSPSFDFYRNLSSSMSNPGSPLQPPSINNNKNNVASVPLAASMMQKMAAAAAASSSTSSTAASSLINPRQRQSHHHVPSTNASTSQPSSPATTTNNGLKRAPKPERSNKLDKDDRHIKKPLNAFMWFMKENRPKLMEEQNYKERQSAELNKELGRRWHILPHEEQQKYYQMAKDDREKHMVTYPGWSARENYALNKKKKRKRDKSLENAEQKKCRARFGVGNQAQWCKHCRRKKRCLLARPGARSPPGNLVSSTTTNSMLNNGNGPGNEDDEEDDDETASESSSSDIDAGEDPIAAAEALAATSDMAPGQSFTMTSEASVPVV